MDRRVRTTAALCTLLALSRCGVDTRDAERRLAAAPDSRPRVSAALLQAESALGLSRRLPPEYTAACVEILRVMHVDPCPPLVPDGEMEMTMSDDSLDVKSRSLSSIHGSDIDAHGGHWTIWVASTGPGRDTLADHMHATGAAAPSRCRFEELAGQRVEACLVPPYPEGGYYGNHVAYGWQRGHVAYNVSLHGHANEPRARLMMAALIAREISRPPRRHFESAAVSRCVDTIGGRPRASDAEQGLAPHPSSGRLTLTCQTLASLVATAYVQFESGLGHSRWAVGQNGTVVTGGPPWIRTDRYTIVASASAAASTAMMAGPMLQTLLEDRFKVSTHYETRDVPVYELTKVGAWYQQLQRIAASGRCTSLNHPRHDFEPQPLPDGDRWCASEISSDGRVSRLNVEGATIAELAMFLGNEPFIGRRISDRTGYPGRYDFRLEFARSGDGGSISPEARRRSLVTSMEERFGLTLAPANGPARFLVVDKAEKPSER